MEILMSSMSGASQIIFFSVSVFTSMETVTFCNVM